MVKVSLWPRMMDKQKTKTGLPLSGPGTDITVSSIHTFSQSASLNLQEYCPVCAAKGKKQTLCKYCISFEESIFLCENPRCFFPLGCKPLNEIIISSISPKPLSLIYGSKNIFESNLLVQPCKPNIKRQKILNCNTKGTWDCFSDLSKEAAIENTSLKRIDHFVSCSKNGSSHEAVDSTDARNIVVTKEPISEANGQLCGKRKEPSTEAEYTELEVPKEEWCMEQILQWKNASALCWLDCILTVLVHLKVIRNAITNLETEVESPFKKLCTGYDQACALLYNSQCYKTGSLTSLFLGQDASGTGGSDGDLKKIPPQLLAQIELILNNVRENFFKLLQPKLRCELGKPDSPVFAFPLLLKQDCNIEKFFMQSYIWSFECNKCGYKYDKRCSNTLTTFTKVCSDWHPLNAVHKSPCNKCQDKDQRRRMLFERISSIYMLHFVDGLPSLDLDAFKFDFQGNLYKICTIIQYLEKMKHFVTWIQNSDGSWLQCDDLHGSSCVRHSTLEVPAHEAHIIIWENSNFEEAIWNKDVILHDHSSSETCPNAPSINSECTSSDVQPLSGTLLSNSIQFSTGEKPILSLIKEIPTPNVERVKENNIKGTLNDNLRSEPDDAIMTLNLVEIKVDNEGNPLQNIELIPDTQQLQNSPQMTIDHNISVYPCTDANGQWHQIPQSVVKSDMAQKHMLQSEMPSSSSRSLHLKDIGVPDNQSKILQKESTVKNLTVNMTTCQVEEMNISTECSETPPKSDQIQKGDGNKISASPILKTPAANKSSADINRSSVAKRSFAVGWGKNLLNRHLSILTTNEPRTTINEVGIPQRSGLLRMTKSKHPVKEHFDGFKSKNFSKSAQKTIKNLSVSPDPNVTCVQNNHLQQRSNIKENGKELLSKKVSLHSYSFNKTYLPNSSNVGNPLLSETGTCNINHLSSVPVDRTELNNIDYKAQKLRLKLLKKLQTKKNQLASLDQLMKTNQCGESISPDQSLNLVNNNGGMVYDDILNELLCQSGVEENESVCTSSGTSLNSNPSHEELLAELFTQTTAATFDSMKHDDLKLYKMPTNGSVANGKLTKDDCISSVTAKNDLASPTSVFNIQQAPKNEFISLTNIHASSFESPIKNDDVLVDLLSISTLNSLSEHELPNFDENLFENC
ncbi:SUMO-specific isopeptidase USPL1 isoform X2 [Narcine bancroftii]|uniref:SUMO-specific isopeptidase USPL1 isoform X2 n=1 Tax=Narcine bancroftii TaxID=1343680 RepID=UPI0038310A5F